jgi:hypothetical protein
VPQNGALFQIFVDRWYQRENQEMKNPEERERRTVIGIGKY